MLYGEELLQGIVWDGINDSMPITQSTQALSWLNEFASILWEYCIGEGLIIVP